MTQFFVTALLTPMIAHALVSAPPAASLDPSHPGSKIYEDSFQIQSFNCLSRTIDVWLPVRADGRTETSPVVVYGHGQALDKDAYQATFEHLAKKGVAVVFPAYDNGFFDQDWQRMGADYVHLSDCALSKFPQLAPDQVVYSGHSKGAYVASIAAGLARSLKASGLPKSVVLFEAAGFDASSLNQLDPGVYLTVVFAEADKTVSRGLSEDLFSKTPSLNKQFILVKSYSQTSPQLIADHMWPLTEKTFFGGATENALHYFGEWKWLAAAAMDLRDGGHFNNPYLYGDKAADKGIAGFGDEIRRVQSSLIDEPELK